MPDSVLDISVDAQEALRELERRGRAIGPALEGPVRRAALRGEAFLKEYPPARSPEWRRTGSLGRSWTTQVTVTREEARGVVGNIREYAPLVQSAERQRSWHRRTGWQTDEQAIEHIRPGTVADIENTVRGTW